jgi:SAM-dependent methyltransferase
MDGMLAIYRATIAMRRSTRSITPPGTTLRSSKDQDHSGRGVTEACPIGVYADERSGISLLRFPGSIARSLWRSQEMALINRALAGRAGSLLDFGCGDGSLASAMYPRVDYGIDIDTVALDIARQYGVYRRLLTFEGMSEIPAASVDTVVSCSVLEHTTDLPACLRAIARVLRAGGQLIFTVPSDHLTGQMAQLVDKDFAESANDQMFHRNLYDRPAWRALLQAAGFEVVTEQSFQARWFTRLVLLTTLLNARALGRIPLLERIAFRLGRTGWAQAVARSIATDDPTGANHFFVARRIAPEAGLHPPGP